MTRKWHTVLSEISVSGQTAWLKEVGKVDKHPDRLQISIKSDSYAFQSHAIVSRWDGEKWQRVHSIQHASMNTRTGLAYAQNRPTIQDFIKDRDELLRMARMIVFDDDGSDRISRKPR